MKLPPEGLRSVLGVALAAWLVVAMAFWLLGAPPGPAALGVAVLGTIGLACAAWWLSGLLRLPPRPGPGFFVIHGLAGLSAASFMILATYLAQSLSTGLSVGDLAREANLLGAEFTFWLWLYLLLAAGSYGSRFSSVVRRARETAARAEARAAEAHLAALRGRLNPHFLFNALHGVGALIRHDPVQAELAIERLGDLLRVSFEGAGEQQIELADELQFVRDYLELERLGLGERLSVEFAVDDSALDSLVPPFSLQSLAENAVRHGVQQSPVGGTISIQVSDRGGYLELVVSDDGPGAPSNGSRSTGGGLANLRDRVDALYGEAGRLSVESPPAGGFVARLEVPQP